MILTSLSNIQFKSKPQANDQANIVRSCKNTKLNSLKELSEYISKGQAFYSCAFNGDSHTKEAYRSSNIITLDFDINAMQMDVFISILKQNNICCNIIYESYSSTTRCPKYHAIWNIGYIVNFTIHEAIAKLLYLFCDLIGNRADRSSITVNQRMNGTSSNLRVKYFGEQYLILNDLEAAIYNTDKTHKSRIRDLILKETNIYSITNQSATEPGISTNSGVDNIIIQGNEIFNITLRSRTFKTKPNFAKPNLQDKTGEAEPDRSYTNTKTLKSHCKYISDLISTSSDLDHMINFKILTNLIHIQGGKDIYREICEKNSTRSAKNYMKEYNIAVDRKYTKSYCNTFCPYAANSLCKYKSIVDASKIYRGNFIEHDPTTVKTISINLATKQLNDYMLEATNQVENNLFDIYINHTMKKESIKKYNITILKTDTGTGKTTWIQDYIKMQSSNLYNFIYDSNFCNEAVNGIMMFVPTHRLAMQVYNAIKDDRYVKEFGLTYLSELPKHYDPSIQKEISEMYDLGLYESVSYRLKKIYTDLSNRKFSLNDTELNYYKGLKEYYETRERAKDCKFIITTHAFSASLRNYISEYKQINTLIFDEDPTKTFISSKRISIKNLLLAKSNIEKLRYEYRNGEYLYTDLIKLIDLMLSSKVGYKYTYDFSKHMYYDQKGKRVDGVWCASKTETLIKAKISDCIDYTSLLSLKSYINDGTYIKYTTIKEFDPKDKKVIITSATPAPKFLYQSIFKNNNIEIKSCESCKYVGNLIQYQQLKSYRKDLESKEYVNKINEIIKQYNIKNIITYKGTKLLDQSKIKMTYGSLDGLNDLEGQDIMVIGTYLQNPESINLLCSAFEPDGTVKPIEIIKNRKIEHLGIEQNFPSFQNTYMRKYQIWKCYEVLEQSIGRARLVRHNCNVILLSGLIHPLAHQEKLPDEQEEDPNF